MTAMETGRIIKALSGFYYCRTEEGTYQCRGKGAFRKESVTPLVGDWVRFEAGEGEPDESGFLPGGFVTEILQRKNQFVRPPVANLDQLCLVSAVAEPAPSPLLLDKLRKRLDKGTVRVKLAIPYDQGGLVDMLYREAKVEKVEYGETIEVEALCPPKALGRVREYVTEGWKPEKEFWEE